MLRAVLVDDEENGLSALEQKLLEHCPQVKIVGAFTKPELAIVAIEQFKPDIVFLDIEMPGTNGFTLLQQLQYKNFELVFVTAYDHYAIKAIRFSALDYLVKPVDIDELLSAVERAERKKSNNDNNDRLELLLDHLSNPRKDFKHMVIPSLDSIRFIKIDEIVYLEARMNYTHIYMKNGEKYVASRTIKEYEELLSPSTFIRIHNSYIINKDYLQKYERGEGGQVIMNNGVRLDVSKRKKPDFLKAIGY